MPRYTALIGVIVLLIGGLWTAATVAFPDGTKDRSPAPAEPKAKVDDAQVKFDALKKRLPGIVTAWNKSVWSGMAPDLQVRLARRTSSNQAKIALVSSNASNPPGCSFVFYLRYYDGVWTTIRWEVDVTCLSRAAIGPYIQNLALAIDESDGK